MKKMDRHITKEDKLFREIITETQIEAGDNLKFRIMQQITTEESLIKKQKVINTCSTLKSVLVVLGGMYTFILCIILGSYVLYGESSLKSLGLQLSIISIASICSFLCFIFVYDERRRYLRKG